MLVDDNPGAGSGSDSSSTGSSGTPTPTRDTSDTQIRTGANTGTVNK